MIYTLAAVLDEKQLASVDYEVAGEDEEWPRRAIALVAKRAKLDLPTDFEYVSTPQGADVYNALWEYQFSVRVAAKLPWVRNRDEPDGSS